MTLPLVIGAEAIVLDVDGLLIDSETACFAAAPSAPILADVSVRLPPR